MTPKMPLPLSAAAFLNKEQACLRPYQSGAQAMKEKYAKAEQVIADRAEDIAKAANFIREDGYL